MKVISMNDDEYWIGESLEACVKYYTANIEDDPIYTEDAVELSDAELDRLQLLICDSGETITFREALALEVEKGGEFPRMFATTG